MKRMMVLLTLASLISAAASAGTMAYWRFEEGPLGANVARGGLSNGTWYPGALDSSGNDYHLSAWSDGGFAGEGYRSNVPMGQVPQTGVVNQFSLQSTGDVPGMWTDAAAIRDWAPTTWTVEAWVYNTSMNNWRVAVGRDGDDIGTATGHPDDPTFRIMFTNANAVRCSFFDMAGNYYEMNTINNYVAGNRWYHLAAVCNGTTAYLYVDGVEVNSVPLFATDPRLSNGSTGQASAGDWTAGNWTVFRGMWNGGHSDRWYGYIDEVRISDTALTPAEFLNSGGVLQGPNDWAVFPEDVTTAQFTVTAAAVPYGHTMTHVAWYMDIPDPNTPVTADNVKYVIDTTAAASTLTIYSVSAADEANYKAFATFSDGSTAWSTHEGHLYINTGLVHRYSFDGSVLDSRPAAAHGTLVDPNSRAFFADGQLLLDNEAVTAGNLVDVNDVSYVAMPAGIISSLHNYMTIEMWLTPHRNANWTTFFAFGDTWNANPFIDGFTGAREGIVGQLNRDVAGARGPSFTSIAPGGGQRTMTSSTMLTLDEEVMYAVTWNGNTNTMRHFVNGVQVDSDTLNMRLSDINDVKCWLGLPFWPDAVLNASLNELRIYDTALPSYYINAHYVAGPDVTAVELKPAVEAPADTAVYPDLRGDDVDEAVMTAVVSDKPAGSTVTAVKWYMDPNPAASGDEVLLTAGAKYAVSFTDSDTTLTIHNVVPADAGYYYAEVTISTGASAAGDPGKLTVSEGLVHRYSFTSDAADSVGTAHGTVVDPAGHVSFAGGQLVLDNPDLNANPANLSQIAYVELPQGTISALHDYMTIELWLTPHRNNAWTPIFAFGRTHNTDPFTQGFNGGYSGILAQMNRGGTTGPCFNRIAAVQQERILTDASPVLALNEPVMYAVTWDGNTNQMRLYINGELQASDTINMQLADLNDIMCWIGIGFWPDSVLNASLDELRIYDWALDAPWISEHYLVGPDQLNVNPCLEYPQFDLAGGGLNGDEPDCQVTMADFAALAAEWLECGRLEGCN